MQKLAGYTAETKNIWGLISTFSTLFNCSPENQEVLQFVSSSIGIKTSKKLYDESKRIYVAISKYPILIF